MKTSKTTIAMLCAVWTVVSACTEAAEEGLEPYDGDSELLEQRKPVTFPNSAPGSGGTTASSSGGAGTAPTTRPNSGPIGGRDAGVTSATSNRPSTTATQASSGPGQITVRDPNGVYFAAISASGSGCPDTSSWQASLAPDGKTFTITFSEYELEAKSGDRANVRQQELDCRIRVNMNSPNGLSYGVSTISYSGYVFLDPGVTAYHTAFYSFTGQSIRSVDGVTPRGERNERFVGPHDDSFLFEDNIETRDVVFSECGTTRALNINTGLVLNNTSPARNGYINLAAIDGRVKGKILLRLTTRRCN